jgi:hypothetical protein
MVDQMGGEALRTVKVEGAVGGHRARHRGEHTAEGRHGGS